MNTYPTLLTLDGSFSPDPGLKRHNSTYPLAWGFILESLVKDSDEILTLYYIRLRREGIRRSGNNHSIASRNSEHWIGIRTNCHLPVRRRRELELLFRRQLSVLPGETLRVFIYGSRPVMKSKETWIGDIFLADGFRMINRVQSLPS